MDKSLLSIHLFFLTVTGEIMRCPKCKHEQKNQLECEACGLIFARYREVQNRRQQEEALRLEEGVIRCQMEDSNARHTLRVDPVSWWRILKRGPSDVHYGILVDVCQVAPLY